MRFPLIFIAVTSIACGVTTHIVFALYVAHWAGRVEMGQFACLEGVCYGVGLILFLVTFVVNAVARVLVWRVTRRTSGVGMAV